MCGLSLPTMHPLHSWCHHPAVARLDHPSCHALLQPSPGLSGVLSISLHRERARPGSGDLISSPAPTNLSPCHDISFGNRTSTCAEVLLHLMFAEGGGHPGAGPAGQHRPLPGLHPGAARRGGRGAALRAGATQAAVIVPLVRGCRHAQDL